MASKSVIQQEQDSNFLGPVNGALGGLPVAERTSDYFAVYTGAGGTGPEIIDQTAIFINYLVDSNGTLSQPAREYDSLQNLIQNFEVGANAIIRNNTGATVDSNIFAKHKVTGIGRQVPLLYSATGSTEGANVSSLDFDSDLNQPVPNMIGSMVKSSFPLTGFSDFADVTSYTAIVSTPDADVAVYDTSNGTYTIDTSDLGSVNSITFRVVGVLTNNLDNQSTQAVLRLLKGSEVLLEKTYNLGPGQPVLVHGTGNAFSLTTSDLTGDPEFKIQIKCLATSAVTLSSFQFNVTNQSPQAGFVQPSIPFWEQGGGDSNLWVTASVNISANYGNIQNSDPVTSLASANDFNLSDIDTPFIPRVGDRIRFEYNPETDFIIYEIITPDETEDGRLKLRLNSRVPSTVNKDNFILHRVDVNDPVYIIFDVKKRDLSPAGEAFQGVILPEFPSQKLKENIDNLILGLREKGILPQSQ